MSYSVSQILNIAKISEYLFVNKIRTGGLWGDGVDLSRPQKIYNLRKSIEYVYNLNPNEATLVYTANCLLAICDLAAFNILNGGLGGTVGGVVLTQGYPIYITQLQFSTSTLYPNTNLIGNNIIVFINEYNRYLIPNTEFTVSAAGLTITEAQPGFHQIAL